jgi:protein-disulfide isomerase
VTVDVSRTHTDARPVGVTPPRKSPVPVLVAILIGIAGIGLAIFAGSESEDATGAPGTGAVETVDDRGSPYLGAADAPVVVVEYSDFRCPFCQRHTLQVKPRIIASYVDEGIVRYEWRDLPFQGDQSVGAALAARAAQAQGRFWDYHQGLFERQDEGFSFDNLLRLATDLDLDVVQFEDDLRSGRHEALVSADLEAGRALGLQGTPSFVINGTILVGAQPYDAFVEVIDAALAAAGG